MYSQYQLAEIYYNGKGIEKNYHITAEWHEKAANQKYAYALIKLAEMYLFRQGIEQHQSKTRALYGEAFSDGFQPAHEYFTKLNKKTRTDYNCSIICGNFI
ncbi:tetratricopeptide repeat protein [Providencia alcalifaciens]|uniref:tetratricopeptide repeat protein n=1 Tax=Providencia TaxID=586 RepID=UPI0039BFF6C3